MWKHYGSWFIILVSLGFCLVETAYFGWNMTPGSPDETIADGISGIIFSVGILARVAEDRL